MTSHESKQGGFYQKRWAFQDILEESWKVIRAEYEGIGDQRFQAVASLSNVRGWGAFPLFLLGQKHPENCLMAPRTTELVMRIPYMTSAGFAVLQPDVLYQKHIDTYPASFHALIKARWGGSIQENRRLHLPLIAKNSSLIVENDAVELQEGKTIVFDNSRMHAAHNRGGTARAILLIDFLDREPLSN